MSGCFLNDDAFIHDTIIIWNMQNPHTKLLTLSSPPSQLFKFNTLVSTTT